MTPKTGDHDAPQSRAGYTVPALVVLLAIHAGMLAWSATRHSPSYDEAGHLPAGISHWQLGLFDLYRTNPPLVRMVATLPVVMTNPRVDWDAYPGAVQLDGPLDVRGRGHLTDDPRYRAEWELASQMIRRHPDETMLFVKLARWACIPFSLLGAYVSFRWARELCGDRAGLLSAGLWCFSPTILAHAQMFTPDVGATSLGLAAAYLFWHWLKRPGWKTALAAGVVLGLAELAKITWIVLFALWPTIWVVWRWCEASAVSWPGLRREALQLAAVLLLALYLINLGYGFEGSFTPLGDYRFASRTFGGRGEENLAEPWAGNRFRGGWLGAVPVPLPEDYVRGIDLQKWDFDRQRWSYLMGEWRTTGWWYYYLFALAIKVPLGTWILILLAAVTGIFRGGYSARRRDELYLLVPAAVVLILVSSQTGFNKHMRYVLPIFPFVFIATSKIAIATSRRHWVTTSIAAAALTWSVVSSLWYFPHSLSYFNELAGGPTGGHAYICGSDVDWSLDFLYLKKWVDSHPEARPLAICCHSVYNPRHLGIECQRMLFRRDDDSEALPGESGPAPGWYAVSLRQMRHPSNRFGYFLRFRPVAMAGYSIYIYHVTLDEANRVRAELGMDRLPAAGANSFPGRPSVEPSAIFVRPSARTVAGS